MSRLPATRERILAVALELFAQRGYAGTSLQDIGQRLAITKAAVGYHFPAKDALLLEVVTPLLEGLDDLLTRAESWQPSPRALLTSYWELLCENRVLLNILLQVYSITDHPVLQGRVQAEHSRLVDLLVGPDAGVEQRVQAVAAIGALVAPLVGMRTRGLDALEDHALRVAVAAIGH